MTRGCLGSPNLVLIDHTMCNKVFCKRSGDNMIFLLTARVLNMEGKANESAPFMESESQLTSVNKACGNGSLQ